MPENELTLDQELRAHCTILNEDGRSEVVEVAQLYKSFSVMFEALGDMVQGRFCVGTDSAASMLRSVATGMNGLSNIAKVDIEIYDKITERRKSEDA